MSYNDELYEICEDALTLDGFDGCDLGVCTRFGQQPIVIYSRRLCIIRLMEDGMDADDANEWFEYNVIGAWVGEGTPAFFIPNEDYDDIHNIYHDKRK